MVLPLSSIDVGEAINAGRIVFYSLSVDFDLEVLVEPHEAYEAVAAEDGHDCHVSGALQPMLEVPVRARRRSGLGPPSRVAGGVAEEPVAELFELDEQPVRGLGLARDAHHGALLVRELGPLVEDERAINLRAGDKKELLVLICGQLAETDRKSRV